MTSLIYPDQDLLKHWNRMICLRSNSCDACDATFQSGTMIDERCRPPAIQATELFAPRQPEHELAAGVPPISDKFGDPASRLCALAQFVARVKKRFMIMGLGMVVSDTRRFKIGGITDSGPLCDRTEILQTVLDRRQRQVGKQRVNPDVIDRLVQAGEIKF